MRTVALIGDPVAHSLSAAMHRAAFAATGLDMDYLTIRIGTDDLPWDFPRLRAAFAGLNVTRPLKEAVLPLLDGVTDEARRAGSVNTVTFAGGLAEGHSTDGPGFLAALGRRPSPGEAVILGTGGAARAVAAALLRAGADVTLAGRSATPGQRVAEALGVAFVPVRSGALAQALASSDLLVNATPVGGPPDSGRSPLPPGVEPQPGMTVVDLVYTPRETALLSRARAAGCRTVEGIEMLVEQGARSFELWTGIPAPVETMRRAVRARVPERTG